MKLNKSDLSFKCLNRTPAKDFKKIREFTRHESIRKNFLELDGSSVYCVVCLYVLFLIEDQILEYHAD